jgi:putative DNA methylase
MKRLIEDVLPLSAINRASDTDKRTHDGHISTLHVWWARRPLPMARSMVYASLLDDPEERQRSEDENLIVDSLPFAGLLTSAAIRQMRVRLHEQYGRPPKVLDCFAGGGAIPLEALRLGCDTTALDLNPVAHLVERGAIEFPQRFREVDERGRSALVVDVQRWAKWVANTTASEVADLYPVRPDTGTPTPYYFWVRTMPSPDPTTEAEIPILSSRLLAEGRRNAWVEVEVAGKEIRLRVHQGDAPDDPTLKEGFESGGSVTCPISGMTSPQREVKAFGKTHGFGQRLYAVCDVDGHERRYREPSEEELAAADLARIRREALEGTEYSEGTSVIPDEVVDEIGYNNLQFLPYGYATWRSLFTDRQIVLYATLSQNIRRAHERMIEGGMDAERAAAVAAYLAFILDKVADRNSAFSSWATNRETIRGTFPGQTVQMRWDFCENYPFRSGSGSWDDAAAAVCKVIDHCTQVSERPARVVRGDAQEMPFEDGEFDAVVIDPPYYSSIMYSDLSDFFYVLLKRSIGHLYPQYFHTPWTPKSQEIVQNRCAPTYAGYISEEEFDRRLERALREVARVVAKDGVVSIVFAHTDVRAWEKLLRALQAVGLVVTTSWPVRSEMKGRPVAQVKAALASSVVLVCRPTAGNREGYYDDVIRELDARIGERLAVFDEMQLTGADYFVSAVGPAFEVFAQYAKVVRLSGEEVGVDELMVLARQVVARHAARKLLDGESLSSLDDQSLLYLTWRWAYEGAPIPADDAYKLARAFDLDLGTLASPGSILRKAGSTFHLLGPDERRDIKLRPGSSLVDVLQVAAQLHEAGRRKELIGLLAESGFSTDPGFWALGSAIAQALPDGDREKTMLLGLTANRASLATAAQSSRPVEVPSLFGNKTPSMFGDDPPTLFEGSTS